MVRIKHRYLLLNILYPNEEKAKSTVASKTDDELPWTVQFRRPSSDQFNGGTLHKMIKNGVSELFGDYGAGMIAGSLQSVYLPSSVVSFSSFVPAYWSLHSQILLTRHIDRHRESGKRALQTRLGSFVVRDPIAEATGPTLRHTGRESQWHNQEGGGGSYQEGEAGDSASSEVEE